MQTPPPSEMTPIIFWLYMMRNVLNRTKTWIKKFSDFYFSSYHRFSIRFFQKNDTKMATTRKIKIGKIWKLVLFSFQLNADLSSKFEKYQKKKKIIENWGHLEFKKDHNSKNKNWKFSFSFYLKNFNLF